MNLTRLRRRASRQLGRVKKVAKNTTRSLTKSVKKAYRVKPIKRFVGTVTKKIKKLRVAKRLNQVGKPIGTAVLLLPLVIPVGIVTASYTPIDVQPSGTQSELFESELKVVFNGNVVEEPTKTISIDKQESVYEAKLREQRAAAAKKAVVRKPVTSPVAQSTQTSDPGFEEKRAWVQRAAASQGIDWRLLEAVWQIESGKQWYTTVRSYAGAQGPCQFMPGTWRGYATDGNGDGIANVYDARDCLFASAKLLARNGAADGDVRRALYAYNRSNHYVATVLRIASSI